MFLHLKICTHPYAPTQYFNSFIISPKHSLDHLLYLTQLFTHWLNFTIIGSESFDGSESFNCSNGSDGSKISDGSDCSESSESSDGCDDYESSDSSDGSDGSESYNGFDVL